MVCQTAQMVVMNKAVLHRTAHGTTQSEKVSDLGVGVLLKEDASIMEDVQMTANVLTVG